MRHRVTTPENLNPKPKGVNLKVSHLVRAALMAHGLTLTDWAKAHKISRSQVSMALNEYRTDPRSKIIRAELMGLLEGGRR